MSLSICPYICQPIFKGDLVVLAIEYELLLAGGSSPRKAQEDEVVGAQSEKSEERGCPSSSLDDRSRDPETAEGTAPDYGRRLSKEKAGIA